MGKFKKKKNNSVYPWILLFPKRRKTKSECKQLTLHGFTGIFSPSLSHVQSQRLALNKVSLDPL
jgi:hypothetical protein